ncbi:VCBS repeat-containing protein [Microbacterium sp. 4R-513]|uniref:FG-GAP repeat domain-containing protein n=1 Tax=Microbacterium sp. 4R-513 TaxID=2567934 RepID=UPI0013E18513|nr:VCBS repeat-containing protein [Microbacterium sp. 4R-513]QIG39406.1 VCBS repeat-containing protein [Microbacterium sp. 4R-513]
MVGSYLDFDGDGRAEVPIRSPWGLGLLEYSGGALGSPALKPNGTRFGGWLLNTADNVFVDAADVDGDGRAEFLVTSPWGIGVLEQAGSGFNGITLAGNGTRIGGWLLNTADNRIGPAGDFDGDGAAEWLMVSPWGLGIMELRGGAFNQVMLVPNGTMLGSWRLDTSIDRFGPVGDVDGDGRAEILVTSTNGIGILKLSGASLTSLAVVSNGSRMGEWLLNTADNHFWAFADFDGDGRSDVLVTSPWGLGILSYSSGALTSSVMAPNGPMYGNWRLNTLDNRFARLGDLDGDGRAEILVTSPWGMGILEKSGSTLGNPWLAPNGTRFGGWLLNTADNYVDAVADVDGDGRDELVVTSPWGIGVLGFRGGTMTGLMLSPNGTRFAGGWLLNTSDNHVGIGMQLLRIHAKVLTAPTSVTIDTMFSQMQRVYELLGIRVQRVSTENLTLPLLTDVDIGGCTMGSVTAEQTQLFGNRNNVPGGDLTVYFVRSTVPSNNGCAAFPAGQPGAVIASIASPWTLGHECGHVLGLSHVDDPPPPDPAAPAPLLNRLMTGRGTWNITNPPPDVTAQENLALRANRLTHNI